MKRLGELFGWVFLIVGIIIMLALFTSGRAFGEATVNKADVFTLDNLSPEDRQTVGNINAEAESVQKDIQIAQLALQVAQAKQNRMNEVVLPRLIESIREAYKLPVSDWTFDLQKFSFARKPKAEESKPTPPDK